MKMAVEALLARVLAQPVPRTVPDCYASCFQQQATLLHERFWASSLGPAEPL
jgi:hypothetical protein